MDNVMSYIRWRGDIPLCGISPINHIDLMVFAELVYAPFPPERMQGAALRDICRVIYPENVVDAKKGRMQNLRVLWEMASVSERFADFRMTLFRSCFSQSDEEQFAGALYTLDGVGIVAFRGTDATLVGWKEDLNMGYSDSVPSQEDARIFLEDAYTIVQELGLTEVYVCGHSKGGNLAMYAAATVSEDARKRVDTVCNFDGPGVPDLVRKSASWSGIQQKLYSYIPEASIIGLLMSSAERTAVVRSEGSGIAQHDMFNWHILGKDFVYADSTTASSRIIEKTMKGFLADSPPEDRRIMTNTLFDILRVTGAHTLQDIGRGIVAHTDEVKQVLRSIPQENRKVIRGVLHVLLQSGSSSVFDALELPWKHDVAADKSREDE